MHRRSEPSPELLRLAEHQALMLSCEQAAAFGLTPNPIARLVRTGQWQRPANGLLYTRPDAPPWLSLAWGGVLLGGDRARLAGGAAAHLHSLSAEPPAELEIKVPLDRTRVATWPWTFQREQPGVRLPSRGDPPRLSVEDVVLDLCAGATETEVIDLVTVAVQGRSTTPAQLRRRLQQRGRVSHRRLLTALLADVDAGAETPLELRYLNRVERGHGLPNGRRQASNRAGHSRDVRYDRYSTVVELDGRLGHDGMGRFRDMRRDNFATVNREATLRYGSSDIYGRPCEVAWQVSSVLVDRGWGGLPTRCGDCAAVTEFGWA